MNNLAINSSLKENISLLLHQQITEDNTWLGKKSSEALSNFESLGFPSTKVEDWKYTSMSNALKKDYLLQPIIEQESLSYDVFEPELKGNIIALKDGIYDPAQSTIIEKGGILEVYTLKNSKNELAEQYLAKHVSVQDAYSNLNLASAQNTLVIYVPKNKVVEQPIYVYLFNSVNENVFSQPRILLVADENSEVKLVEMHQKMGNTYSFCNAYTEIYLRKNATVHYYKIQPDNNNYFHVGTTQVVHEETSVFEANTITLGGSVVRNNLNIVMQAQHCDSTLNGLYVSKADQHIDNHTLVDHAMPHCLSNELYKGVLAGKSTGVFNGKIFVRLDAQKTNAFQSNKNILLSSDATMNTKPQLEIFADDVKCSHGATVGQLDEEPLFYLRSRGLSESTARALLVGAFAQDIVEHIKLEPLKLWIQAKLEKALGDLNA